MAKYTIIISQGDILSGIVRLEGSVSGPAGSEITEVNSIDFPENRFVHWEIKKNDPTIESFRIERNSKRPNPEPSNPYPFTEHPSNTHDKKHKLKAEFWAGGDWSYTIFWKAKADPNGEDKRHDPIISVRPKLPGPGLLGIILALLLGISSLALWKMKAIKAQKKKMEMQEKNKNK